MWWGIHSFNWTKNWLHHWAPRQCSVALGLKVGNETSTLGFESSDSAVQYLLDDEAERSLRNFSEEVFDTPDDRDSALGALRKLKTGPTEAL